MKNLHFKPLGQSKQTYFPLQDGLTNQSFRTVFRPVIDEVMARFRPEAVVMCCGADSITGDTLLWTFGLKDFLNDDYILEAQSIVYSKKRIQFLIIAGMLLVLIIAVILIKFKR